MDYSKDFDSKKTGAVRAKFIIESVMCLRKNLKSIGNGLLISRAHPENFLPHLLSPNADNIIVYQ